MKRISSLLIILMFFVFILSSCTKQKEQHFIDFTSIDSSVRPQDDFFGFANGSWLKNTAIPASETGWGSFYILNEKSVSDIQALLDELMQNSSKYRKGSIEQLTADLYKSGMDSLKIEESGITSMQPELDRIAAIEKPEDILKAITRQITNGYVPLYYNLIPDHYLIFYVYQDDKNSKNVVAHFDQGSLGLPTRDYYLNTDSVSVSLREAYLGFIANIFNHNGVDENTARSKASKVLDLETRLARASKGPVEMRDPVANYNKFTVSQIDSMMPGMNWPAVISDLKISTDTVLMGQPEYYKAFSTEIYNTPVDVWKDMLSIWIIRNNATALGHKYARNNFEFYNKRLYGQQEMKPRWKRISQVVDAQLKDALGQLYVERYFPPDAKSRMDKLVSNLIAAYRERIESAEWMSDSTKIRALDKLSRIKRKIGYPDKWDSYRDIDIVADNYMANLFSTRTYAYNKMIARLGKPVDPDEWLMSVPTINAYYNGNSNEIVFPAGILQPPFFNKDADDAVNYGAIGTVIAHEITHGFDDKGRLFDSYGNLTDWWTEGDATRFNAEAAKIVNQYNQYTVLDGLPVNGELTQGENIADLGGVLIAYHAFKMTPQGKSGKLIDGLTPDQRFFLSYTKVWQIKSTDESLRNQVLTDPHSPEVFRVNGPLTNLPEFYAAFDVKPGDKLYKPDSLHVRIW